LQQVGTIPQALLRMNGRFTAELSKVDLLSAPSQIMNFSPNNQAIIDHCFLACLCRRPTSEEQTYFLGQLDRTTDAEEEKDEESRTDNPATVSDPKLPHTRADVVQDLFWTLFNSPEFSWNH
jgi:hypothetical protein